jgi:SAM-dependent methyltransferase
LTISVEGYTPSTYGDSIAPEYDQLYGTLFDVEGAVDFLAETAGSGPVLELGIGTGRLAIPLVERGINLQGVDSSNEMVSKLRSKPGGEDIPVIMGDFSTAELGGPYDLIFIAFNTLFAILSQDEQVAVFERVGDALNPGGVFVVEAFVPDPNRFQQHQTVRADSVSLDEIRLDVSRHDPLSQRVDAQHLFISAAGIKMYPVVIRYAWPSELDLMARLAGLRLKDRYSSWKREPFVSDSTGHVSVYEKH